MHGSIDSLKMPNVGLLDKPNAFASEDEITVIWEVCDNYTTQLDH